MRIKERIIEYKKNRIKRIDDWFSKIAGNISNFYNRNGEKEKRRLLVLTFSAIFFLDYIMFCHHAENSILAIFPSIPSLEESRKVNIYLPTFNDMSIEKESRKIPVFDDRKREAMHLFYEVVRGSKFENTSLFVPLELYVRKIWFLSEKNGSDEGLNCIIDVDPGFHDERNMTIPGSEELFRKAVEKTLMENIPGIARVTVVERGIPDTHIWDYTAAPASAESK